MKYITTLFSIFLFINSYSQTKTVQTGDSIPKKSIKNNECLDKNNTSIRLIGREPIVPFAIIDSNNIKSAGQFCCLEWSTSKSSWFNLDKFGKIVGKSIIKSGDGYDVTNCYELEMKTIEGQNGIGLYISKKADFSISNTSIWKPKENEILSFDKFINDFSKFTKVSKIDSVKSETIFFKTTLALENEDTLKFAVCGGQILTIAYLSKSNNWVISYLDNSNSLSEFINFKPFALLDINKDGIPEIFYQENLGHIYWDKILQFENRNWTVKAISVGGAKI